MGEGNDVTEKPEEFFDVRGRQRYLTAREQEMLRRASRPAPAGDVIGAFAKILLTQLAMILVLVVVTAVLVYWEDGGASWQSAYLGALLMLLVPLAGTVWTLVALGKRDFSGPPGTGTMRFCSAVMAVAFVVFIATGVWVLSLMDPVTYDSVTVSQLMWSAIAVPTTIVGTALLMMWTWRLPIGLLVSLALALILAMVFVGLLPLFQVMGYAWPEPLLLGLRFVGPALLVIAISALPTNRALLLAENDPVDEFIDRAVGNAGPRGSAPGGGPPSGPPRR